MKRILIAALTAIFTISTISAQTEGTIRYLVTHNWVKKIESCDYLSKERKERASYMWGKNAEWKMYGTLYFDKTHSKFEDSEEKAEAEYEGFSWRKDEFDIYRDFENKTIHDVIKLLDKVYVIDDSLRPQPWKILNDMKEVAGHICMNASYTDTVKGQTIVAWFALDIPISAGPERFCGLPGMILEININKGALIMSADKIDPLVSKEVFVYPQKQKGKHIPEADYYSKIEKYILEKKAEEEPYFWGLRY